MYAGNYEQDQIQLVRVSWCMVMTSACRSLISS